MLWSLKLFTVRGIPVRVHVTFLLVLVWAAYLGVAGSRSSAGAGPLRGVGFMILFVLLLFVCVVLHELGHSLVAQLFGVQVQDITLWPIGGVARMARMPETPFQEFIITAAGPATNVVLTMLLSALALVVIGPRPLLDLLSSPLSLLGIIGQMNGTGMLFLLIVNNLLLALFNLVPAFPMDGGRLFRATLAAVLPFRVATQAASWVGQAIAALLVAAALFTGNVGMALIGVLIFFAAGQERGQAVLDERLGGLFVRQAMRPLGQELHPLQTLGDVAANSLGAPQAAYAVLEGGRLVGCLGRGDLLSGLRANGPMARVRQRMEAKPVVVAPGDSLLEAQRTLGERSAPAATVLDGDGRPVGMLFPSDVLRLVELIEVYPAVVQGDGGVG